MQIAISHDPQPTPAEPTALMAAMHWAYDHASAAIPGLGSAEDLADRHLRQAHGDAERAIDDLIAWQTRYAGAAGFLSNLGGALTLPISVPANLASVLLIQLRMIAAIAHLRGYKIDDERVRTLAFLCLTGSAGAAIVQDYGVSVGTKITSRVAMRLSHAAIGAINQRIGSRLIARTGFSLGRFVPVVGGLIGGAFDATVTKGIGKVAKHNFERRPGALPLDLAQGVTP